MKTFLSPAAVARFIRSIRSGSQFSRQVANMGERWRRSFKLRFQAFSWVWLWASRQVEFSSCQLFLAPSSTGLVFWCWYIHLWSSLAGNAWWLLLLCCLHGVARLLSGRTFKWPNSSVEMAKVVHKAGEHNINFPYTGGSLMKRRTIQMNSCCIPSMPSSFSISGTSLWRKMLWGLV